MVGVVEGLEEKNTCESSFFSPDPPESSLATPRMEKAMEMISSAKIRTEKATASGTEQWNWVETTATFEA